MAQDNKQTQNQVQVQAQQQVQVQTLSPQQVMLVRLTEMPIEALQQRIENECLENPWLEKASPDLSEGGEYTDDAPSPLERDGERPEDSYDYRSEDDIPDYLLRPTYSNITVPENVEYGDTLSFYDQLKAQMSDFDLTEHERTLLEYLIGELDGNGLLGKPLIQIIDEAEIYQGIETSEQEMLKVLDILQQFEPAGIGARTLQECLLLQIKRDEKNPYRPLLQDVIEKCYDDFIHKRWERIQQRLNLSALQTEELKREIKRLNPRPGSSLGEKSMVVGHQITPDFIVDTDEDGHISMQLNGGDASTLMISDDATEKLKAYEKMKDSQLSKAVQEDIRFTREYVERGQLFIEALAQRRESMIRTMNAIIKLQRPFFLEGDDTLLKPMRLEDVATLAGYDISTVSRVCNSKYVQTPFGIYSLKHFFTHKAVQKDDAEMATSKQVMAVIQELIDAEDKQNPLSDEKLSVLLKEKGYDIARRTIAKYREAMKIPIARMRK
ncbi:MAG: RNA polymerase factor sigma-54 [Bacteroidaceae bacterium]|nr:RNA polymerase factor sigma-54 [Bacteroidaceae bacterium]